MQIFEWSLQQNFSNLHIFCTYKWQTFLMPNFGPALMLEVLAIGIAVSSFSVFSSFHLYLFSNFLNFFGNDWCFICVFNSLSNQLWEEKEKKIQTQICHFFMTSKRLRELSFLKLFISRHLSNVKRFAKVFNPLYSEIHPLYLALKFIFPRSKSCLFFFHMEFLRT